MSQKKEGALSHTGVIPLVMVLMTLGMTMFEAAQLPLLERSICRSYYAMHKDENAEPSDPNGIPEHLCKIENIQSQVARLSGQLQFFTTVQSFLMAIPYAWLANRGSRKPMLLVSFVSTVLSMIYFLSVGYFYQTFDIKMVWLTHLFDLIGGGIAIAYIMLYSLLTEAIKPSFRAAGFYLISAAMLCTRFVAMSLSGVILQYMPLLIGPLAVSIYLLNVTVLAFFFVSAKTKYIVSRSSSPGASSAENLDEDIAESVDDIVEVHSSETLGLLGLDKEVSMGFRALVTEMRSFLSVAYHEFLCRETFQLCFAMSFTSMIGMNVQFIQQQWVSVSLGWTLAGTTYLSAYATFFCAIVLLFLPRVSSHILVKLKTGQKMEVYMFEMSVLLRVVGAFSLGLSPDKLSYLVATAFYTLGSGTNDSLKALMTSFTADENVTKLFTVVAMIEAIASIVSSQLYPWLLTIVLKHPRIRGLPYLISGLCTLNAFLIARRIKKHLKLDDSVRTMSYTET